MVERELPAVLRRDRMASLIQERGFIRVAELSRIYRISPVTIRTDLDQLETMGLVRRVHGGAVSTTGSAASQTAATADPKTKAKIAIGAVAASLVESGQTVVLGNGSTTRSVARALVQRTDLTELTVITNGLEIALDLQAATPRIGVIVTGGTLRSDSPGLTDPLAQLLLQDISAEVAIIGCKGISVAHGVTDDFIAGILLNRCLLEAGRRRVVVADSTKVGVRSAARICSIKDVDVLVTEDGGDEDQVLELRRAGVTVETVP